ncbi:probable serpin E3 [Engraulis encrasicolus]|uniref:probable serpin E3 n=1 Tax=Engraulis encrasicolus TaxID=184585 RepID=UPI002FD4687D
MRMRCSMLCVLLCVVVATRVSTVGCHGDPEFALRLYSSLRATENSTNESGTLDLNSTNQRPSNVLMSPASIGLGLRLLAMGARGNTLTQLHTALPPDFLQQGIMGNWSAGGSGAGLHLSSVLLVQSGLPLRSDFTQHALQWANSSLLRLDFSSRSTSQSQSGGRSTNQSQAGGRSANQSQAAGRSTNHSQAGGQSTNQSQGDRTAANGSQADHDGSGAEALRWLLEGSGSSGGAGPVAVVTSLVFRGAWLKPFLSSDTHTLPFTLPDGTHTKVAMMHQTTDVNFGVFARCMVLELPYSGHALSLTLLLPSDRNTPLSAVEAELTPHTLELWDGSLRRTKMDVFLPRFRLQARLDLRSLLMSMGITDAFNSNTANLKGMTDVEGLYVSEVLHQASMEVTEDGTKAAASTAMLLLKRSRAPVFKADRPFIFLLRHINTGSILFMGRVMNPTET